MNKPILSYEEQIDHFVQKDITFNTISKDEALEYLKKNNNFFKLSSYRKNFPKRDGTGKYINLDFAYLTDLAIIDTRLRIIIIEMALNIEHFAKVQLIKKVTECDSEDGYTIVKDYLDSLDLQEKLHLEMEIERNKTSLYVSELYKKYHTNFPIWVFVEILTLGSFIHFYRFCANRFNDSDMKDNIYLFLTIKKIRNASAHNNCILNDLTIKTHKYKVNYGVNRALSNIGIKYSQRKRKMACERTAQIITCFYTHKRIVSSAGSHNHIAKNLNEFSAKLFRDFDYAFNPAIQTTFKLFQKVIDKWFLIE